jgi:hypothetical protein
MISQFQTQRQPMRCGLSVRRAFAAGVVLILGATAAMAQTCAADRTALEMAGHTLCLLDTAMPEIGRREDGSVQSLTWSHPERLPDDAELPPGTFYLIVEVGKLNPRSLENTGPSILPEMRQTTDGLATHLFPSLERFHPVNARLNGQSFVLECRDSINPAHNQKGGQDCEIYVKIAEDVRAHIDLGTVVWGSGPAWPKLDKHWIKTWPSYLDALGTGINNLLSIQ